MSRIINALLLASGLAAGICSVQSGEGEAQMSFHGMLIEAPPCTINDGNRIDVDFGENLAASMINGVNYRQAINYQIVCNNSNNPALTLTLNGLAAEFDGEALQSYRVNLAIRIYQNDMPFTPNSTLKIEAARPPRLAAVPVRKPGAPLSEGPFSALVTLRADYQ